MNSAPNLSDYVELGETIQHHLSSIVGINTVAGFGETKCPGISDIDFWIFFDEKLKGESLRSALSKIQTTTSIALDGRPIPIELTSKIHYLIPSNFSTLETNLPDIEALTQEQRLHLAYTFVLLWLPIKLAALIRSTITGEITPASLRSLYSCQYTLQQMEIIGTCQPQERDKFQRHLTRCRDSYVAGNPALPCQAELINECIRLFKQGVQIPHPPSFLALPSSKQDIWLPVDWTTWICFRHQLDDSLGIKVIPLPNIFPRKELRPIVIELPYYWAGVLGHLYDHPELSPFLPWTSAPFPKPIHPSRHLRAQADIFSAYAARLRAIGIRRGSIISPLIRKYGPGIATLQYKLVSKLARNFAP